jgi:hypothetical protein
MAAPIPLRRAKALSPEGFAARVTRVRAELIPILERLVRRHGPEVTFGGMLEELEDALLALREYGRMTDKGLADLIERLRKLEP